MDCTYINEEKKLLQLLHSGDESAFVNIYNFYWDKMFAVAAYKLGNLSEAEEIVQDIFVDLWKRRSTVTIHSSLSSYLNVCVKFKIIDLLEKKAHLNEYQKYISHAYPQNSSSTEEWVNFEDMKDRISKATGQLPKKCRLVFNLSRQEGLSQKQIAAALGISEKTVESHLTKALRSLRSSLTQFLLSSILVLVS